MKRLIGIFTALALVFSITFTSTSEQVSANATLKQIQKEIAELKKRNSSLGNQKNNAINNKKQTESEINANLAEQKRINDLIKKLDNEISKTNEKIRVKEKEIDTTKKEITKTEQEIKKLKQEIEELKQRIKERELLLKDRLRTLQKNGGDISYLEVILGAKNFGDFLNRATAVTKIMDQDKVIMEKHQQEKRSLEEKKVQVEQKKKELEQRKASLEKQKRDLEKLRSDLAAQRSAKQELMDQLKQEEEELHDKKMQYEEQAAILSRQQSVIQKEMKRAQSEAAAEQRRIEEERRRAAAAKKKLSSNSSSKAKAPKVTSSGFMRPANGPVTSGYGARWGSTHFGIDIGKRGGSVPIVAAASGTVLKSYYSSSYGNVVYLTHFVNGQLYTTVYAHLQNREVRDNQTVKKGQRLGYMGSTGHSTGPHLHFELHKGSWNYSKSNAVNPARYINF